ncbi:alpha/beta fold hydrolase [Erythrobacter sp. HA6-11]
MITRHVLTVRKADGVSRKVHYRRCGNGPALLMIHQSPRSSKEYEALMLQWGEHFTCIAPDTPGFGQSEALPEQNGNLLDINVFADALAEFVAELGFDAPPLAYGFHSGAVILMTAIKRHPQLFSAMALGGYAVWNEEEMRIFGDRYLPPFQPSEYGEHMTWLWHRIMEQSWFFPWFHTCDEARLPNAHDDPEKAQGWVEDLLDAGDAYRAGYGAVLRAPRDIPEDGSGAPPCLITAYDGDPLQPHIDRLGALPDGWDAYKVKTPEDHQAASLAFLRDHSSGEPCENVPEDADEGWLDVGGGLIHWRGQKGAGKLVLHPAAQELTEPGEDEIAIDLPGHGQSDDHANIGAVIEAAREALGCSDVVYPATPKGDPDALYPDLSPDRFGTHLSKAWSIARAEAFFDPWNEASREHAIPVDSSAITAEAIHARALARLRAGRDAAIRWHETLAEMNQTLN